MTTSPAGQVTRPVAELLGAAGLSMPARTDANLPITQVTDDSRSVTPGSLFVAIPGTKIDGRQFLAQAAERGAALAITEPPLGPVPSGLPVILIDNARHALAVLAHAFHGWPTRGMLVVGVTGTNGKTTTTYLLEAILKAAGRRPGVIGTVEGRFEDRRWPAPTTTPSAAALAAMTAEMRSLGGDSLAMEVSSHAIEQERVTGIEFDAGIFTNLSQDHLDYHGTMESYGAVKRRFFTAILARCRGARAVVNIDEPLGIEIAGAFGGPVITYGRQSGANVRIEAQRPAANGAVLELEVLGERWSLSTALIGPGNAYNIAGVVAWAQSVGIAREVIREGIAGCTRVPGRLEAIHEGQSFQVVIDYSHTPASLEIALRQCRELARKRVIVVFGCGGDRDPIKRPIMGEIASRLADLVWVTNDNPRTEDPEKIADQILQGVTNHVSRITEHTLHVQLDRRAAIHEALRAAEAGDVVLIAGKGHETYQEVGKERHPFDDAQVAREWLAESRITNHGSR
jgi:UDP-N-acetylmuramoyl-L-alanyl-D-glutamate--2,6-diaminopimelate ligase